RLKSAIEFDLEATQLLRFTAGLGAMRETVQAMNFDGNPGLWANENLDTTYFRQIQSWFAYVEGTFRLKQFNIVAGGRYESTFFGDAFVPRIGITGVFPKWNAKLLIGRSFRIPLPYQAFSRQFGQDPMKPELATSFEAEIGFRLSKRISLKTNFFFHDIIDPIIYQGLDNSYGNYGRIQSLGTESELIANFKKWGGFANVSWVRATDATSPEFRTEHADDFVGFPSLKINGGLYYQIWKFEIAPSFTYLGDRHHQTRESARGETDTPFVTQQVDGVVLPNICVSLKKISVFDFSFTIHNFTNEPYQLFQPYYGSHAPIPAFDRHFVFKVTTKF
ncbi:MAG: TonB-dependent receptor, partial [Bacteroidia bacterium]|nr:TonB-dependent receptor [Bacteroidia bacterium]